MALAEASTLISVPICATGSGTIRLVEEVICARILDVNVERCALSVERSSAS